MCAVRNTVGRAIPRMLAKTHGALRVSPTAALAAWMILGTAAAVLLAGGCSRTTEHVQAEPRSYDLTGVPLSEDLGPAARAARAALEGPQPDNQAVRDVARFNDLDLRIQRPSSRASAGRELRELWRSDPTNFLWIELAAQYREMLGWTSVYDSMRAHPLYADSLDPVGAFVRSRPRYSEGARGAGIRRAWDRAAELDTLQRTVLVLRMARLLSDSGENLGAVRLLLDQAAPARALAGARLETLLWYDAAKYLVREDRLDDALQAIVLAMDLADRVGDRRWYVQNKVRLGAYLNARREYRGAAEVFQECIRECEEQDFPWLHVNCLDLYATTLSELGDMRQALVYDLQSVARSIASGDSFNVPRNLVNVSDDYRRLGDLDSSLVYMREARRWVEASRNERNRAMFPMFEAELYSQMGYYAAAESLLSLAFDRARGSTTPADEARLMLQIIQRGLEMGEPRLAYEALGRLERVRGSLHGWRTNEDRRAEFYIAMTDFLAAHGEFRRAREALDQARAVADAAVPTAQSWDYHRCAGELAMLRGDLREAEASFRRCLAIAESSGDVDQLALSRFGVGHILLEQGRTDEARDLFLVSQSESTFGGRYRTKLSTLVFLGITYARDGAYERALECFDQVVAQSTRHAPPDLAARVRIERGRSLAALGLWREAQAELLQARKLLSFGSGSSNTAELRAFSEDARRDLTEVLVGLYVDHPDLGTPERRGWETLNLAEESRWGTRPADASGVTPPLELRDLCDAGREPVAAYFIGRNRSFVWVADASEVTIHPLPGRDELGKEVWPVVADLATPGRPPDPSALAEVSRLLLGPVMTKWPAGATLRIVPDDLLFSVPWGALPVPGDTGDPITAGTSGGTAMLVCDYGPVLEAPALADLADLGDLADRAPETDKTDATGLRALILGVDGAVEGEGVTERGSLPSLRHAEAEAREVAALWPSGRATLRLGAEGGWGRVGADALRDFDVIHIASHAVIYQGLPARAALRLAGPADAPPLTLPAVSGLKLRAQLVYLSCCEGATRHTAGPALMDFGRAFLGAGARSVVAASIRVDDEASRFLAARFYTHWLSGEAKATALRSAQQEVRAARPDWAHPYFWAFYRLIGHDDLAGGSQRAGGA